MKSGRSFTASIPTDCLLLKHEAPQFFLFKCISIKLIKISENEQHIGWWSFSNSRLSEKQNATPFKFLMKKTFLFLGSSFKLRHNYLLLGDFTVGSIHLNHCISAISKPILVLAQTFPNDCTNSSSCKLFSGPILSIFNINL